MDELTAGFLQAVRLILSGDPALMEIIVLSLGVSGLALVASTVTGKLSPAMG